MNSHEIMREASGEAWRKTPFDVLSDATQKLLVAWVQDQAPSHEPCAAWEAERFLRALNGEQLAVHIAAVMDVPELLK